MKKDVNPVIQNDIQRYKKNKLGSSLALFGIVFACVYFIFLYAQVKNENYWLPLAGITETAYVKLADVEYRGAVLSTGTFAILAVGLAGSGACVIASAVIGFIRSKNLENFQKKIESGEVSVEATLKELDKADETTAQVSAPETEKVAEEAPNA